MHSSLQTIGNGIVTALTNVSKAANEPRFLHEVLAIKRARGDEDCAFFELNSRYFTNRLNSTVAGAYYTASQTKSMRRFAKILEEFTHA